MCVCVYVAQSDEQGPFLLTQINKNSIEVRAWVDNYIHINSLAPGDLNEVLY